MLISSRYKSAFSLLELMFGLTVVSILLAISVVGGKALIYEHKLSKVRQKTVASSVNGIENLGMWLEVPDERSFAETKPVNNWLPYNWNSINPQKNDEFKFTQAEEGKRPVYIRKGINDIPSLMFEGDDLIVSDKGYNLIKKEKFDFFIVARVDRESDIESQYLLSIDGTSVEQQVISPEVQAVEAVTRKPRLDVPAIPAVNEVNWPNRYAWVDFPDHDLKVLKSPHDNSSTIDHIFVKFDGNENAISYPPSNVSDCSNTEYGMLFVNNPPSGQEIYSTIDSVLARCDSSTDQYKSASFIKTMINGGAPFQYGEGYTRSPGVGWGKIKTKGNNFSGCTDPKDNAGIVHKRDQVKYRICFRRYGSRKYQYKLYATRPWKNNYDEIVAGKKIEMNSYKKSKKAALDDLINRAFHTSNRDELHNKLYDYIIGEYYAIDPNFNPNEDIVITPAVEHQPAVYEDITVGKKFAILGINSFGNEYTDLDSSNTDIASSSVFVGKAVIYRVVNDSYDIKIYKNKELIFTSSDIKLPNSDSLWKIGNNFKGLIGEIVMFEDRELSQSESDEIYRYLSSKWDIKLY